MVGFLVIFTLGYQGCPAWSLGLMSKCLLSQKKLRLVLHKSPDSKFSPSLAGGWKGQLYRRALIWYLLLSVLVLVLTTVVLPRSTLEHFPWNRSFCYTFCIAIILLTKSYPQILFPKVHIPPFCYMCMYVCTHTPLCAYKDPLWFLDPFSFLSQANIFQRWLHIYSTEWSVSVQWFGGCRFSTAYRIDGRPKLTWPVLKRWLSG